MNRLIGLVGHARSGKDTVCAALEGARFAFADPLRRFAQEVFDFTTEQVHGSLKNEPDARYTREDGVPLTPRFAMQTLGTEWGRRCHQNIWAELGVREALEWLEGRDGLAVITDCRFVNEAHAIRAAGGEVWRVTRPGLVLAPEVLAHPSEAEQDTEAMEALIARTIVNDGTLEDLGKKVQLTLAAYVAERIAEMLAD